MSSHEQRQPLLPFYVFTNKPPHLPLKRDILATLAYFDLFDYPLTQTEIFSFLGKLYSHEEFVDSLNALTSENQVCRFGDFYSLQDNYELLHRRLKGNLKARKTMEKAQQIAGFLSNFPFVRGIAVSGSLSKNFADENSDIDFFIITAKNRLWLARTFMHLFKKFTFLVKKQDWFCMNYYIDEEELQIREQNIYTAIEVVTLIPIRGIEPFGAFYAANTWSKEFLPNYGMKVSYLQAIGRPFLKKLVEVILDHTVAGLLDSALMKMTSQRWAIKTKNRKRNKRGCILSMDAGKHYAKPHPESFQKDLISRYEKKLFLLLRSYDNKIQTFY